MDLPRVVGLTATTTTTTLETRAVTAAYTPYVRSDDGDKDSGSFRCV